MTGDVEDWTELMVIAIFGLGLKAPYSKATNRSRHAACSCAPWTGPYQPVAGSAA